MMTDFSCNYPLWQLFLSCSRAGWVSPRARHAYRGASRLLQEWSHDCPTALALEYEDTRRKNANGGPPFFSSFPPLALELTSKTPPAPPGIMYRRFFVFVPFLGCIPHSPGLSAGPVFSFWGRGDIEPILPTQWRSGGVLGAWNFGGPLVRAPLCSSPRARAPKTSIFRGRNPSKSL